MATKYLEVCAGASDARAPLNRTTQLAAGIYVDSSNGYALTLNQNGTVVTIPTNGSGVNSARATKYATLALTGAAVHAAAVGIVNPEAVDVLVVNATLALITHATAASGSIDVGWTSASITTASHTMQDGILVGSGVTAPVTYPMATPQVYWTNGTWITVSDDATADVTGMVATLYIEYILL